MGNLKGGKINISHSSNMEPKAKDSIEQIERFFFEDSNTVSFRLNPTPVPSQLSSPFLAACQAFLRGLTVFSLQVFPIIFQIIFSALLIHAAQDCLLGFS